MTSTTTEQTRTVGNLYRVTLNDRGRQYASLPADFTEPVLATPDTLDSDWVIFHPRLGFTLDTVGRHVPAEVAARFGPDMRAFYLRPSMVTHVEPLPGDAGVVVQATEAERNDPTYSQGAVDVLVRQARDQEHAAGMRLLAEYKDRIRAALIAEGERREWCDQLDEFLRDNGFEPRQRTRRVTLTVQFQVEVDINDADDDDDAIAKAENDLRGYMTLDPFESLSPVSTYLELTVENSSVEFTDD
jgi:hypothetical protein